MQRQLLFTNQGVKYDFIASDSYILVEATVKNKIKSLSITYQYQNELIKTTLSKECLSPFNLAIDINNEIDFNHFIDGYITYISLFYILENTKFSQYLPFTFYVPCLLSQGDCCDYHILQYMYPPLKLMLKLSNQLIYHYFNTITYFIDIYKELFPTGTPLNPCVVNDLSLMMMNVMLKKSITCHQCHNRYKNNLIKCLICQKEYILEDEIIKCEHCHQSYNECRHNNDLSESFKSEISELTDEIKIIKNQLESLTQINTQLTEQLKKRHKRPKHNVEIYSGSNY